MNASPTYEELLARVQHLEAENTEYQLERQTLRESERLYRLLFSSTRDAAFVYTLSPGDSPAFRLTDVNREACRRYGYSRREFLAGMFHPLPLSVWHPGEGLMLADLNSADSFRTEMMLNAKDGRELPVEITCHVMRCHGKIIILSIHRDISQRLNMAQAADLSERRYKDLFENANDAIFLVDTDLNYIDVNQKAVDLFGYSKEEFLQMKITDVIPPQQQSRSDEEFRRLRRDGFYEKFIGRQRTKNGRWLDIEVNSSAIVEDGKIIGSRDIVRDITDRIKVENALRRMNADLETRVRARTADLAQANNTLRQEIVERQNAEQTLRESEEQYRRLVQTVRSVILRWDNKGRILFCNEYGREFFGYTEEEIQGRQLVGTIVPVRGKAGRDLQALVDEIIRHPESFAYNENENVCKDGRRVWIAWTNQAVFGSDGRVKEILSVGTDITARKQAEKALVESEEQFRQIAENIEEILWMSNPQRTRLFYLSPRYEEIFGEPTTNLYRDPLRFVRLIHPADRAFVRDALSKKPGGYDVQFRIFRADGQIRWMRDRAFPIRTPKGKVFRLVGITEDITEHKQTERELQKIQKLESLGVFAGGIAHDFNNLLTSILGNIELTKLHLRTNGRALDRLARAEKASLAAKSLTRQLLTFAKGGAPVIKTVSPAQLIKDSVEFTLRGAGIKAELNIADDLRPVEIDEGQISQVIQNIVKNAEQAMTHGGTIRVRAENTVLAPLSGLPLPEGNYLRIIIQDQGIGFQDSQLGKIFDPYFTTKKKGTGLGLSVSYSIVKGHRGYITAESEPGGGTTFYLYLPSSPNLEAPGPNQLKETTQPGEGKILIMDDQPTIREILGEMLNSMGYEVEHAGHGEEAVDLYQQAIHRGRPFDVVILDLTIPGGMGGQETFQKLLEIDPQVKAIVSSGYANNPIMADFRRYGFCGVVPKPYQYHELNRQLYKVIKGCQSPLRS